MRPKQSIRGSSTSVSCRLSNDNSMVPSSIDVPPSINVPCKSCKDNRRRSPRSLMSWSPLKALCSFFHKMENDGRKHEKDLLMSWNRRFYGDKSNEKQNPPKRHRKLRRRHCIPNEAVDQDFGWTERETESYDDFTDMFHSSSGFLSSQGQILD